MFKAQDGTRVNGKFHYFVGNPIKFLFREHKCIYCKKLLEKRKHYVVVHASSPEARRYNFSIGESSAIGNCEFSHTVFYCSVCDKEIEPITQISFEDNEKWTVKRYDKLLKHVESHKIRKVYLCKLNQEIEETLDFEKLGKILFIVNVGGMALRVPCSVVKRMKRNEQPYNFKKARGFRKALREIKKLKER
ncbi:MAG: hypothetical protein FWD89_02470 [Firmicutes bacterium]|nr:hypothetical protein [Bacillota bacterium]